MSGEYIGISLRIGDVANEMGDEEIATFCNEIGRKYDGHFPAKLFDPDTLDRYGAAMIDYLYGQLTTLRKAGWKP